MFKVFFQDKASFNSADFPYGLLGDNKFIIKPKASIIVDDDFAIEDMQQVVDSKPELYRDYQRAVKALGRLPLELDRLGEYRPTPGYKKGHRYSPIYTTIEVDGCPNYCSSLTKAIEKLHELSFGSFESICDIGAGYGLTLATLAILFHAKRATGIELEPVPKFKFLDIVQGDAFNYVPDTELIYMYYPIMSSELQLKLDNI